MKKFAAGFFDWGCIVIYYIWLSEALETEFEELKLLKNSDRGRVSLIRHRTAGERFILHRFTGNAQVYGELMQRSCPNLPQIFEVASDGETNIVLEEYIQGDNMGMMLKGALFTPGETREIVRQLCRALWVLHSMGAVHRDVKPENVVLRGKEAVLIDFDAARFHNNNRDTGDTQILGTLGFAAPEQYGLSQSDAGSDIYALGVLINVMLTGEHPSRKLAEGRWGRMVTRCTQVNPAKRYKNVLRLLDEL